jgi:hypothetical protein
MICVLRNQRRDIGLRCVERRVGASSFVLSRRAHLFLILFVLAVETNEMDAKGRREMTCVGSILGSVAGVFDCLRSWCVFIFVWRTCVDVGLFAARLGCCSPFEYPGELMGVLCCPPFELGLNPPFVLPVVRGLGEEHQLCMCSGVAQVFSKLLHCVACKQGWRC